jgi:hypothetical protein
MSACEPRQIADAYLQVGDKVQAMTKRLAAPRARRC